MSVSVEEVNQACPPLPHDLQKSEKKVRNSTKGINHSNFCRNGADFFLSKLFVKFGGTQNKVMSDSVPADITQRENFEIQHPKHISLNHKQTWLACLTVDSRTTACPNGTQLKKNSPSISIIYFIYYSPGKQYTQLMAVLYMYYTLLVKCFVK